MKQSNRDVKMCNTDQKYVGKGNSETTPPQMDATASKASLAPDDRPLGDTRTLSFTGPNSITINNEFGLSMKDPVVMNWIRQDVRAWFMAYIPTVEGSYVGSDLQKSIEYYQLLDEFLSELVEAGISQQKGGQANV